MDASILYRRMIEAAILSIFPKAVIHQVVTAAEAAAMLSAGPYQLVMLDTNTDGGGALRLIKHIREAYPHVHVVLMGKTSRSERVMEAAAMELGVRAYMVKPIREDYESNMSAIHRYIAQLLGEISGKQKTPNRPLACGQETKTAGTSPVALVVMTASTGGPSAIEAVLTTITDAACPPLLIVQHMPAAFTKGMAEGLAHKCALVVKEAEEGDLPCPGYAYIAPGGTHMMVKPSGRIGLVKTPFVNGVRPSADVLFTSVADVHRGEGIVAAILTGMGKDGADGVQRLKTLCDCHCIAQSKDTCVVYGMPREVVERGLADQQLAPRAIGGLLHRISSEGIVFHEH